MHKKLIHEREQLLSTYLDVLKALHNRKYVTEEKRLRRDIRRIRHAVNQVALTRRQLEAM